MAKPNFSFQKRQKEQARERKKQEKEREKELRKIERANAAAENPAVTPPDET